MRLIIRKAWNRLGYHVWIAEDMQHGTSIAKPVTLEFGEPFKSEAFELPEPTLYLNYRNWDSLKKSACDEMIAEGIIKDPARIQGELEATKKHLEDMKRLVFEPNEWSKNK